jgi:dTDP-4-amino-4,6-dideoxygalactose transaminase
VPAHCRQPYHLFYLLTPSSQDRDRLVEHLAGRGIASAFHYLPLHQSPMGRRLGGRDGDCPVAEDVSRRLLRLPFYTDLSEQDQNEVVSAVRNFSDWSPSGAGVGQALSARAAAGLTARPRVSDV